MAYRHAICADTSSIFSLILLSALYHLPFMGGVDKVLQVLLPIPTIGMFLMIKEYQLLIF